MPTEPGERFSRQMTEESKGLYQMTEEQGTYDAGPKRPPDSAQADWRDTRNTTHAGVAPCECDCDELWRLARALVASWDGVDAHADVSEAIDGYAIHESLRAYVREHS